MKRFSFALFFVLGMFFSQAGALAQESTKTITLEASVKKQEITLQSIKDVRLDLKRVRSAAADIFDEVTRQPISYQATPNVVGTVVINVPISIQESGFLEPRKGWIENSVNKMGPIIELLRKDIETIGQDKATMALSSNAEQELDKLRTNWVELVKHMHSQYRALLPLLKESPYQNRSIAARTRSIYLDTKDLEKTRRKAEKLLRKELKRRKKEQKRAAKKD